MPLFDPALHATAFADAQSVLDWVVRDLSTALPRGAFFACFYRSHPALEIALSAECIQGRPTELAGLHEAFAHDVTVFDRWQVQSRQRNRWVSIGEIPGPSPLADFWNGRGNAPHRRLLLCHGDKPLAYLSARLLGGGVWEAAELRVLRSRVRRSAEALRLAALSWRARHAPDDRALSYLRGADAVVVLGHRGQVLARSPEAERWLARDVELRGFLASCADRFPKGGSERLRHFRVGVSVDGPKKGADWRVVRLTRTTDRSLDTLPAPAVLTRREGELCDQLVRGGSNADIAEALGVRPSTVKTMLERLYARLEVKGRVALVQWLLSER